VSYSLKREESVEEGIRRVIEELVAESIELAESDGDLDERIHEIRKALKRVRAALRLVRPALDVYGRENRRYRDAGRLLSDLRDAYARLETVDELEDRLTAVADPSVVTTLRATLQERHRREFEAVDVNAVLEDVAERLRAGSDAFGDLALDATGFDAVSGGLLKSYRRGRRLFAEAHSDASVEVFHTWRKRVKYHRYHVDLSEALWAPVLDEWEDALHDLTDDLGLAHDVAVLDEVLVDSPDILGDSVVTQRIRAALHEASAEFRRSALRRGRRAFAETPEALVQRFQSYWDAWQRG
jgi:CHAD domain-containing protein